METKEKILSNLIIKEKENSDKREEQLKTICDLLSSRFIYQDNWQTHVVQESLLKFKNFGSDFTDYFKGICEALYQPITVTDPDGKKWTMQREKPNGK